jgi:hypothetical protein
MPEMTIEQMQAVLAAMPKDPVLEAKMKKDPQLRKLINLMDAIAPVIFEAIISKADPLKDRLKAAKTALASARLQIETLENAEQKTLADAYKGPWMHGAYRRGDLTTQAEGLWLCLKDSEEKPGTSDAWKMVTKPGRDAPTK